jgi:hypothetical protein
MRRADAIFEGVVDMATTLPFNCQMVRIGSALSRLNSKEEKGEPLRVMPALQATDHYIPH